MNRSLNFLITILVIIILAYVFAPETDNYRQKLKVVRGIQAAEAHRAAVSEFWERTGRLPRADELGKEKILIETSPDQEVVEAIRVGEDEPGTVTIHYKKVDLPETPTAQDGNRVVLIPEITNGQLTWTCWGTLASESLPRVCRPFSGN